MQPLLVDEILAAFQTDKLHMNLIRSNCFGPGLYAGKCLGFRWWAREHLGERFALISSGETKLDPRAKKAAK